MPKKSVKLKISKNRNKKTPLEQDFSVIITLTGSAGRKWIRFKEKLGFSTDIELVDYLLQLIPQDYKKRNEERVEKELPPNNVEKRPDEGLRSTTTKSDKTLLQKPTNSKKKKKQKKGKSEKICSKAPPVYDGSIDSLVKTQNSESEADLVNTINKTENIVPHMMECEETVPKKCSESFSEDNSLTEMKKVCLKPVNTSSETKRKASLAIKIKLCNIKNVKKTTKSALNSDKLAKVKKKFWMVQKNTKTKHKKDDSSINKENEINSESSIEQTNNIFHRESMEDDTASSTSELRLKIVESYTFAESTLPVGLFLNVVNETHGLGVFSKNLFKTSHEFGPLIGETIKEMDINDDFDMKHIWEVNGRSHSYTSTANTETSNWLRYIRPAPHSKDSNLILFTKQDKLYFVVSKQIMADDELLYWDNDAIITWCKRKLDKSNCGGCNIKFTHPFYYRKHCTIFHDPNLSLTIRKYHCKICGEAVLGKEKITKHAAEMHQGKGAYQCQFCHKFFLRLNYLEMHRTYGCAKNPRRTRPLCDLCGRKFCQPQKLKVHIKRMHSDLVGVLDDFQCKICTKLLGSKAALQRHMKEVHRKDVGGTCTCDRCGKSFQNKSNLKIHMLTHSGVKPFKCQVEECSAAFTTKQCLQFHYRKTHGLANEMVPRIERSVEYTFDAYSGGNVRPDSDTQFTEDENMKEEDNEEADIDLDEDVLKHELPTNDMKASDEDEMIQDDQDSPLSLIDVDEKPDQRVVLSKGSKKWMGNEDESTYRRETSNASLLVEAAISAAEKDIADTELSTDALSISSIQSKNDLLLDREKSTSPDPIYLQQSLFLSKKDDAEKNRIENKEPNEFVDYTNYYRSRNPDEKSPNSLLSNTNLDLGLSLKYLTLPRINSVLLTEMQKETYHLNVLKDIEDAETYRDEMDYRTRDISSEVYRTDDALRYSDDVNYRTDRESDIDREFDISNDCYRNLEKSMCYNRIGDLYTRSLSLEPEVEAQNLCLKGKLDLSGKQYDSLEELAKQSGKDSGLDCLLVGDSLQTTASRVHPMLSTSPRYHPTYDTESVDLSVPRPSYPSPPVYTLDLTPSRHFDLRNHLGAFTSTRVSTNLSSSPPPPPPSCYSLYQSPYMSSPARPSVHLSPPTQFNHYTPYY